MKAFAVAALAWCCGLAPALAQADLQATERAFWNAPSWQALKHHALALEFTLAEGAPRPRAESLERMKDWLARGVQAPPPPPLADWAALQERAAGADLAAAADAAREALRLGSMAPGAQAGRAVPREVAYVRSLALPVVRPSLWRNEAEVGPAGEPIEQVSGRFGIVHRTTTTTPQGADAYRLYDMAMRVQSLVRPVQRVRLFRDGRLDSRATTLRNAEHAAADDGCENWVGGFAAGDVEGPIWSQFGDATAVQTMRRLAWKNNPAGSLFVIHTTQPPPRARAERSQQTVRLDRDATGFARATQLGYDLDGDGVPDLLVVENAGPATGHMDEVITADLPWHRVVFANIGGRWKVLASDAFSFGCGC